MVSIEKWQGIGDGLVEARTHAAEEYPKEAVGLIWDDGTTTELINSGGEGEFNVTDEDLAQAIKEVSGDREIAAVYHSHPKGSLALSPTDMNSMAQQFQNGLEVPWLIVTPSSHALYTLPTPNSNPVRMLIPQSSNPEIVVVDQGVKV